MRLPPEPVLRAAKRWLEVLPSSGGVRRAQALLTTHPSYSDLTPTQYAAGLTWAKELGLVEEAKSPIPVPNRILNAIFEKAPPLWFQDADELVRSPAELPSDIVAAGLAIGLDPVSIFDQLVRSWGKVDTATRERVGAAGEAALYALLSNQPGARVDHVSNWSDGFGYDISFAQRLISAHIEVKSTTRRGRFTAYLSRNEYSVMQRDDRWMLVTVRLTDDFEIAEIGSVPKTWIVANAPRDTGEAGSWASFALKIPDEIVVGGMPQIGIDALGRTSISHIH